MNTYMKLLLLLLPWVLYIIVVCRHHYIKRQVVAAATATVPTGSLTFSLFVLFLLCSIFKRQSAEFGMTYDEKAVHAMLLDVFDAYATERGIEYILYEGTLIGMHR